MFCADAAFHAFVHISRADALANLIFAPLFEAAAILFAAHDAREIELPVLSRFVERAWAVIVVEFITTALAATAQAGFAMGSGGTTLFATLLLTFTAMLIYAPADALLGDTESPLLLVPHAFTTSLRLAWRNISRVFALFSILLGAELVTALIDLRFDLLHRHQTGFWVNEPIVDVVTVGLAVIVTAAYVDLTRGEKKAPLVL